MNLKKRRALAKQKKRQKKQLRTARRLHPSISAKEYFKRGILFTQARRYESALSDFNQAIALSPKYAKAYNHRGFTYQKIKQYEAALRDFNQAIALNPNFAEAYNNRGTIYFNQKQYETALNNYNQAIVLNPNLADTYVNRGLVYLEQKNYTAAQTDFDSAIEKVSTPEKKQLFCLIAYSYFLTEQLFDKAEIYSEQLEKLADEYELSNKNNEEPYLDTFLAKVERIFHQLQVTNHQLEVEKEESRRFKYLNSMATAVAHEINQPVGIIRAATSAALSDIQDNLFQPTELEALLNKIYAQTERLRNIIENFRKFAKGDRQHREKVNLNQVVAQTIEIFGAQFKHHNIELIAILEETSPEPIAWANPFQLEEVLINLLNNAKDALAGFDNPQVWIKTSRTVIGATEIQVEDNGPGIAPEFLEKLFMPFESTKPTERGTGLGLHISRKIIEALGGTLNYTARNGGGAAFNITFPPLSESEELNNE